MSVMCRYILLYEYGVQVRVCVHDHKYKPDLTRVSCVHLCVLNAVKTSEKSKSRCAKAPSWVETKVSREVVRLKVS